MSVVLNAIPLPQLYYQPQSRLYWRLDNSGRWMQVDKDTGKKFVMSQGQSARCEDGGLSPADNCLLRIQSEQNVSYAASLAGRPAGLCQMNNEQILVTDSPRLIQPAPGDWPVLGSLLEGMLNDPEHDQRPYLYGWLKVALEALRSQRWAAGQLLALAGPVRGGKSLVQSIITNLLGGRSAFPYQFMTGQTTFNADLFRAEHLVVDDQAGSTDIRARREFAAAIKQVTGTREHRCHPKNGMPITLQPFWRMSISLNDERDRLQVLPPLDEDIIDKVILLKVRSHAMPMPTLTTEQKDVFWRTLLAELPAFAAFLDTWTIPENLGEPRFGIASYHHPELVQQLAETTPENRLLEMIDIAIFGGIQSQAWTGRSSELAAQLTSNSGQGKQAAELLRNHQSCGSYLARLERTAGTRVSSVLRDGNRLFTIRPPAGSGQVDVFSNFNTRREEVGERRCGSTVEQRQQHGPLPHLPPLPAGLALLPTRDPARN